MSVHSVATVPEFTGTEFTEFFLTEYYRTEFTKPHRGNTVCTRPGYGTY